MHLLEIFLYIFTIVILSMILIKIKVKKILAIVTVILTFVIFILQIALDGAQWQLYPIYLATVFLTAFMLATMILNHPTKKLPKKMATIFASVLIVISGLLSIIFPTYQLPTPGGDYLIGTESFIIEDNTRLEIYTDDPNDFRRFKIQIWYPSETVEGYAQVPWLEDGLPVSRALSKDFGFPSFALDQTARIMSHAYLGAPISEDSDTYPVVIISHGWRGFRDLHVDYAEELASRGYIVVSIDHTYGSVATVFSEKDIAYLNRAALPDRETTPDFLDYANRLVNTYAGDVTTTLDYLETINDSTSASRFSGVLDLTRIGLLGHSTGGGADVTVALNDDRIDALIGLDAWVEPIKETDISKDLHIPSLFLRSETWETGDNNVNLYQLVENSSASATLYQIDKTTHFDFAMVYMYSPLTNYIGLSGKIQDKKLITILKTMITDFFDATLKGDGDANLDTSAWEEVRQINPS